MVRRVVPITRLPKLLASPSDTAAICCSRFKKKSSPLVVNCFYSSLYVCEHEWPAVTLFVDARANKVALYVLHFRSAVKLGSSDESMLLFSQRENISFFFDKVVRTLLFVRELPAAHTHTHNA